MNVTFVVADAAGKILRWGHCPEEDVQLQAQGDEQTVLGEGNPATHYVANGKIATRPASSATLTGATLTNLPPCDIRLNGQTYRCEDGQANLSLPPGEYRVTVSAWPCLDANFTVRV